MQEFSQGPSKNHTIISHLRFPNNTIRAFSKNFNPAKYKLTANKLGHHTLSTLQVNCLQVHSLAGLYIVAYSRGHYMRGEMNHATSISCAKI